MVMIKKTYTYASKIGNKILCRGFYKNGERFLDKEEFYPTLFISGKKTKEEPWYDIYGNYVYPIRPGTISECKEFLERYKDVKGFQVLGMTNWVSQYLSENYSDDIQPDFRFIRIYTIDIEVSISEKGFPTPEKAEEEILLITVHDNLLNRYNVYTTKDIDDKELFSSLIKDNGLDPKKVKISVFSDEFNLLKGFINDWVNFYPDAVTGWNIETFDIPYLIRRIEKILGKSFVDKLSPFSSVKEHYIKRSNGNDILTYDIEGIAKLDYLELMKKYTYGDRESWKLGDVAKEELGQTKLEFDCSLAEAYKFYWSKFVAYNIIDVYLVERLENKFKLIELAYTIAYMAKINPDEIFSPIRTWDSIIYNHLKKKKIVIPEQRSNKINHNIAGGFVKDPQVGKQPWVVSFDFASLYPSLMVFLNISPECILTAHDVTFRALEAIKNKNCENYEELKAYLEADEFQSEVSKHKNFVDKALSKYVGEVLDLAQTSLAANGVAFLKTKKGFVPELIENYYELRKNIKNEMLALEQAYANTKDESLIPKISSLNTKQMAIKILMNSLYGAMASPFFRFFDLRLAEAITLTGQLAIQWVAHDVNQFLNKACQTKNEDYIIYSDTDSLYVSLKRLLETEQVAKKNLKTVEEKIRFMEKFSSEILQQIITKSITSLGTYLRAYDVKRLQMKLEKACSSSIFVAKKRYALKVHSSEGVVYPKPKISVTGLEIVRSSTPSIVKESLKNALEIIMEKSEIELRNYINDFKKTFNNYSPVEIAFPRGVNGLETYSGNPIYSKGCPIHVRAALLYNHYVKKLNLESKYELITEGSKIKFLYLKMPNNLHENVIGFIDKLPEEFGVSKYVDYDMMFNKTFIEPLQNILDVLGWSLEEKTSLEDFFV